MNYGKEFKKYATKHHGINNLYYDKIVSSVTPMGMTPYIMEERQMNVFSVQASFSAGLCTRLFF